MRVFVTGGTGHSGSYIIPELIAAGQAVAIVSAGLRADSMHPDLTTIALEDVDPTHVVLATRASDRSRLVAAFRKYAQDCLTGLGPATDPAQA